MRTRTQARYADAVNICVLAVRSGYVQEYWRQQNVLYEVPCLLEHQQRLGKRGPVRLQVPVWYSACT